ncbi:MAG: agmatinase [Alphaproteobacteria bacterium]|jgi:agmatinase|nr:agmatinase [Alphaproteobacteria bacterium]
MAGIPTFALEGGFLAVTRRDPDARFVIAGVPFDIGTTNRGGARFGPAAIRKASHMLVDGSHPVWRVDPGTFDIADIGNFAIALGEVAASYTLIEGQAEAIKGQLITLGGDHGIALPLLRALRRKVGEPLGLVHFDAHVDTWPDSFGQPYGHGSCFYHAVEEGLVDPTRMIQIGIRSPVQNEVMDWTLSRGITVLSGQDVHARGPASVADEVRRVIGSGPAYLSFDIDALDPAFAPGTGTPEIGGLATWQAQAIIRALKDIDWRGMDMVEVLPAFDHAEITALAAATMVWEYLALLGS